MHRCKVEELKASMPIAGTEGLMMGEGVVVNHAKKESHEGSLGGDNFNYDIIKIETFLNVTCITFLLFMFTMFDLLVLLPPFLIDALATRQFSTSKHTFGKTELINFQE